MSELTRCNYCSLQEMQRRAKARGVEIVTETDAKGWIAARFSNEAEPSAHFMMLTDHCVC